ncbi:hypothetical protein [Microvirga zambiensis]|uniref:hypothetical protein n=1 Tax=Microvirga zambiensis TaxID=1402137 RepID=UPI00191E1F75|nr:hypothetical protein [Microvirga zambiensis]
MAKAFSEMSPAEIEAWNVENGLTEDDDDYRYPENGMTSEEIWIATGGEDTSDDNRNGFTELTPDELVQVFTMMQGMVSTKN